MGSGGARDSGHALQCSRRLYHSGVLPDLTACTERVPGQLMGGWLHAAQAGQRADHVKFVARTLPSYFLISLISQPLPSQAEARPRACSVLARSAYGSREAAR